MESQDRIEVVELGIRGMTCDDCARHVTTALEGVKGVQKVALPGWKSRRAEVRLSADTPSEKLVEAIRAAGYGAEVRTRIGAGSIRREPHEGSDRGDRYYDLIVIGSGGAGMAAAIRAAEAGYRVAIVEAGTVGGTCVNVGCVPSKTLIRAAQAYHFAGHNRFEGVETRTGRVDWAAVVKQKDMLVEGLRKTKYLDVLASYGELISLIRGTATIEAGGGVSLDEGGQLRAGKIVIATGASPRVIALDGITEVPVLTSTSIMSLERLPKSLIVIGGRAVAVELGQTWNRLGTEVTILQRSGGVLPEQEPEVSEAMGRFLVEEGIKLHTGTQPTALRRDRGKTIVRATVGGVEHEFIADAVLMATGRLPNTNGLGLEAAGVEVDESGFIKVDEQMRTSNPDIYAAGDVTNHRKLVYVAAAGGSIAAANALEGLGASFDTSVVPEVVFTDPQVASVGLTERDARAAGYNVRTSILPLEHVPRALAARDTRGMIKLVADVDTDRLLGGHVVAPEGGEIIQTLTLAVKFGIGVSDLRDTLFPYLTLSEGVKLAAQTFEKDVARLSCCAG